MDEVDNYNVWKAAIKHTITLNLAGQQKQQQQPQQKHKQMVSLFTLKTFRSHKQITFLHGKHQLETFALLISSKITRDFIYSS